MQELKSDNTSREQTLTKCEELEQELQKCHELVCAYTQKLDEVLAQREELFRKYQDVIRELAVARQRLECAGEQMLLEENDADAVPGSSHVDQ